jgi:hypothetical protein
MGRKDLIGEHGQVPIQLLRKIINRTMIWMEFHIMGKLIFPFPQISSSVVLE